MKNKKTKALLFVLALQLGSNLYLLGKYVKGQKKYMYATQMIDILSYNFRICKFMLNKCGEK